MQRLHLQGGFGEKGRTSVLVDDGESRVMLDAGIKVGAPPDEYHPQLAHPASEIDALFTTHAHEDHIGALCWLIGQGFHGPVFMTRATRSEMEATLDQYAHVFDLATYPVSNVTIEVFEPGDELSLARQRITTGHTGHVAGGVWFAVQSGGKRTLYCGDVVPESAVFPMSAMPEGDMMLLDCSYGDDCTHASESAERIVEWVAVRPMGSVLPTPLSGRSLEFLAILPGQLAIADLMYEPLREQIADPTLLKPGVADRIAVAIGTRDITYRYEAVRNGTGTNSARLDTAFLSLVDAHQGRDMGAVPNTARADAGETDEARLQITFPTLYPDWERGEPLAITWNSFGDTGGYF